MKKIIELPNYKSSLFSRIYSVSSCEGKLRLTEEIKKYVVDKFGSLDMVEKQTIVSVKNKFTKEQTLYNELRSKRPIEVKTNFKISEIENTKGCAFCLNKTPADEFGRISGKYCITASNLTKYECNHGLIIFKEHNPLKIKLEYLEDYLETAKRWFDNMDNKKIKTKLLLWNCLWRGAASIIHGHMQVVASKTKYGKIELLENAKNNYNRKYKSDYFSDLYKIHNNLGLSKKIKNTKILFYLTPIKEKEIFIFSKTKNFVKISEGIYYVLKNLIKIGVVSFNLVLFKIGDYYISRILDRGNILNRNCDIGGMELYAASVVSSDPFKLIRLFR
ncbi:MAG: hypothetical protein B6U88_01365 [Candidatus Aenigmarchaeota archaeon ex4484_56]|nr:MAG: hypothetical protein B6U88_01365 [Candidatus Aenigmarchaeota archaeon ex4484_56]